MEAFIGQICAFPYNYPPRGWLPCDGRLLGIRQYTALFALVGVNFGGDGKVNFALPDLRGRMAVGTTDQGGSTNGLQKIPLGERGGGSQVTLSLSNLPAHNHALSAQSTDATSKDPNSSDAITKLPNGVPAKLTDSLGIGVQAYGPVGNNQLDPRALSPSGSLNPTPVPLQNPSLAIAFFICTEGVFPSRP
jgi:microcystin-dependent protein